MMYLLNQPKYYSNLILPGLFHLPNILQNITYSNFSYRTYKMPTFDKLIFLIFSLIISDDMIFPIPDKRLVERDMGELEGRPREEYNAYLFWDYDLNKSDFGVEPLQDVFKRCEEFLNYILEKHSNQDILIVTHGAPYRALRYLIKKHPLKGKMLDGFIDNCQYEEFEI